MKNLGQLKRKFRFIEKFLLVQKLDSYQYKKITQIRFRTIVTILNEYKLIDIANIIYGYLWFSNNVNFLSKQDTE